MGLQVVERQKFICKPSKMCIKKGEQAIMLVPEISLTPQMVKRFKDTIW